MDRRSISLDGYFDIETEHWDQFVVGGFFDGNSFNSFDWKKENQLADRILSTEGSIWAHNGGKYDTLWLLDRFISRYTKAAKVFLAGQRIVCLQIGKCEIRDSAALIPIKLEKAAQIGGHKKLSTGLPCICKAWDSDRQAYIECGGYCSISRKMKKADLEKLKRYLKGDCIAGWDMLKALIAYGESHDLDLCTTIGASAWATARRWADLPAARWALRGAGETTAYHFAAKGYFGGRTQVFKPRSKAGHHCDVNSAYVHALRTINLPCGQAKFVDSKQAIKAFESGKEGIFHARVTVYDQHIPPLPFRGRNRIYYPLGPIDGYWAANELRYALSHGTRIKSIERAIIWSDSKNLFRSFCEEIWSQRHTADQGGFQALREWLKFFGNSLTGKLAQNPQVETIEIYPEEVDFCPADFDCQGINCPQYGGEQCCPHGCAGTCERHTPLDKDQKIWSKLEWQMPACGHVHWAAYLTAHQRTWLHSQLIDGGKNDAVYCDTDSCFSEYQRTKAIGGDLGEWGYEGRYRDFYSIAPKTYSYIDDGGGKSKSDPSSNKRVAKAKGIFKPEENWGKIVRGEDITQDRGVMSFKSVVSEDRLFRRKEIIRRVKEPSRCERCGDIHVGDRILRGDLTYPMHISSVLEHESRSIR